MFTAMNSEPSVFQHWTSNLQENERQLSHWEFRHRLLKRMKAGYDHARKWIKTFFLLSIY